MQGVLPTATGAIATIEKNRFFAVVLSLVASWQTLATD